MYKLIGKEIANGTYMGKEWKHLKLYCICDFESNNPTFEGQKCEILKIKNEPEKSYNEVSIGDSFKVYYDKFGNICEISIQQ